MKIETAGRERSWSSNLAVLCLLIVIGLLIYGNSFNSRFQYDDNSVVVKNFNIQDIKNIPRFFVDPGLSTNNPADAGHYRPFVTTSYAINYAMGGLNPVGYHLVNLAFHVGTAFLIYLIVKAMLGGRLEVRSQKPEVRSQKSEVRSQKQEARQEARNGDVECFAALTAGLIFLVHPFNSEAVNYTTARSSVMSGFFYLLGFWCWVRYRSQKSEVRSQKSEVRSQKSEVRSKMGFSNFLPLASCPLPLTSYFYLFSLLAFIFGMLSKEVAVTLPLVLFLYDLYFPLTLNTQHSTLRTLLHWRTYIPYLPFVLIVVIPYLLIRLFSLGRVLDRFQRDIITQIFTEVPVLVKHWQMFFLPRGLSLFHDVDIYHGMTGALFVSMILLFLYIVIAIYTFWIKQTRWRVVSFFMFWFFIVLLPTTLIPLNAIFQENRGYLAIVSFSVLAGLLLKEFWKKTSSYLVIIILVILVGGYSIATVQRNRVWQDDIRLWKDAAEKAPRSVRAYAGLAAAYRDRGDLFLSIETAKRGITVDPNDYEIHLNLGRNFHLVGEIDRAINEYEQARRILPKEAIPWNDLATLYSEKGDLERTEQYLKEAVRLWDTLPPLHYNLGVVFMGRGKYKEAVEEFQRAIAIYPYYFRARYELAGLFEKLGRFGEADEQYRKIIRNNSNILDGQSLLFGEDRGMVNTMVDRAKQQLDSRNRFKGEE